MGDGGGPPGDGLQDQFPNRRMEEYFQKTARGRLRASQVIPQPFFVHSELSTMIQVADLVAYVLSWGFRLPTMKAEVRTDLAELGSLVSNLRYVTRRDVDGNPDFVVYSLSYISDLRGRDDR